jgi:hypothetical protein
VDADSDVLIIADVVTKIADPQMSQESVKASSDHLFEGPFRRILRIVSGRVSTGIVTCRMGAD